MSVAPRLKATLAAMQSETVVMGTVQLPLTRITASLPGVPAMTAAVSPGATGGGGG